jgi:gluconate 2-dehydrogenase gamma chain
MSTNIPNSRRSFLGKALWLVPAAGGLAGCDLTASPSASTVVAPNATNPAGPAGPTGANYLPKFLTKDEWAFVTAATDRLIPADAEGPGAVESGVPEFIDRQMETPYAHGALWYMQGPFHKALPEFGYQLKLVPRDILRLGIAATERQCQAQYKKHFAQLDHAQQEAMLGSLEKGSVELADVPARTFFGFLLQITREGFFSDPIHGGNRNMAGWKLIGFPGARADFMDFVNQNGAKYPLPPVSIGEANPKA